MLNITPFVALVAVSAPVLGQPIVVPAAVIARTGDAALTGNPGDVLTGFVGTPAINASGRVAFIGSITTNGTPSTAIYSDRTGTLQLAALAGTPIAPGSSDPTRAWAPFTNSTRLYIADNQRLVALTTAVPAFTGANAAGVVASDAETDWSVRVMNGQPIPGTTTNVNAQLLFASVDGQTGETKVLTSGGFPVRVIQESPSGLAVVDEFVSSDGSALLAHAPIGTAGANNFAYYASMTSSQTSPQFFRGRIGDRSGMLLNSAQPITIQGLSGEWRIVLGESPLAKTNRGGQMVIPVSIRPGTTGVANGTMLLLTEQANTLVAAAGDPIGALPGVEIDTFGVSPPLISDSGSIAATVTLRGAGVNAGNDRAVMLFQYGSPHRMIVRRGGSVPELPGYAITAFTSSAITPDGSIYFGAQVTRGAEPAINATFGIDAAGHARLLVANGASRLQLGSLGAVTVTGHSTLFPTGGYDGGRRQTADNSFVTVATHAGGQAVVRLAIPCAPDIGVGGGGSGSDGLLDNNDFIVFINDFFEARPLADRGIAGGLPGQDGLFDNNDFIAFIGEFFDGCE